MTQVASSSPMPAPPTGNTRLLLVAIGLAILAVVLVNVYIEAIKSVGNESTFTAYILKAPIDAGEKIESDKYDEVQFPMEFRDAFRKSGFIFRDDQTEGIDEFLGRTLVNDAENGQALRLDHFRDSGRSAPRIPVSLGKRVATIPVIAGFNSADLVPGTYVDLIANIKGESMVVMENVRVVGVGKQNIQELDNTGGSVGTNAAKIDIEIDPDYGVTLADITSRIIAYELWLRPPADKTTVWTNDRINREVLDKLNIKPRQPPAG